MRVRVVRFLGREACACVLGGLAYDDSAPMVVNLLHLYIFLAFFITPYALASAFEGASFSSALFAYTAVGGSFFAALKVGNHALHGLLTKSKDEPLEQPVAPVTNQESQSADEPHEGPTPEQLRRIQTERRLTHEFDGLLRDPFQAGAQPVSAAAPTLQPVRSHRRLLRPAPDGQRSPSPTSIVRIGSPGHTPRPSHEGETEPCLEGTEDRAAGGQESGGGEDGADGQAATRRKSWTGRQRDDSADMTVQCRRVSDPVGKEKAEAETRVCKAMRHGLEYTGERVEREGEAGLDAVDVLLGGDDSSVESVAKTGGVHVLVREDGTNDQAKQEEGAAGVQVEARAQGEEDTVSGGAAQVSEVAAGAASRSASGAGAEDAEETECEAFAGVDGAGDVEMSLLGRRSKRVGVQVEVCESDAGGASEQRPESAGRGEAADRTDRPEEKELGAARARTDTAGDAQPKGEDDGCVVVAGESFGQGADEEDAHRGGAQGTVREEHRDVVLLEGGADSCGGTEADDAGADKSETENPVGDQAGGEGGGVGGGGRSGSLEAVQENVALGVEAGTRAPDGGRVEWETAGLGPDEVQDTVCVLQGDSETQSGAGSMIEGGDWRGAREGGSNEGEATEEGSAAQSGEEDRVALQAGEEDRDPETECLADSGVQEAALAGSGQGSAGRGAVQEQGAAWQSTGAEDGARQSAPVGASESDEEEEAEEAAGRAEGEGRQELDDERWAEEMELDNDCSGSLIEGVTVNGKEGGREGAGEASSGSQSAVEDAEWGESDSDTHVDGAADRGEDSGAEEGERGEESESNADVLLNLPLDGDEGTEMVAGAAEAVPEDSGLHTYIDENGEVQQYMFYSEDHLRSIGLVPGSDMSDLLNVLGNMDPVDPFGAGGGLHPLARRLRARRMRSHLSNTPPRPTKTRIEWTVMGKTQSLVLPFDRHLLEYFLDRSLSWSTVLAATLCWVAVASVAASTHALYDGPSTLMLWLVAAAAQNSLLKSPQPDAVSVSAFDPSTAYIRPFLFCLVGSLALVFHSAASRSTHPSPTIIYGVLVDWAWLSSALRDFFAVLQLCSPALHLFGVVPAVATVLHQLLEQVHVNAFGGSGTPSLEAAILAVSLECAVGLGVWMLAEASFSDPHEVQAGGMRSGFALGLAVTWSATISKMPTDLRYWRLLWLGGEGKAPPTHSDRAEASMQLSGAEFRMRVARQLLLALALGTLVGCLQGLGLFEDSGRAFRFGVDAMAIAIAVLWFPSESVLPPLRYAQACLLFKAPLLQPAKLPSPPGTDPILPQQPLLFLEKLTSGVNASLAFALHPLLVALLATQAAPTLADKFGSQLGSLLWAFAVMKLSRSAMQGGGFKAAPLAALMLMFRFDLRGRSETLLVDYLVISILMAKLQDLWLKLSFVVTYAAPWNVPWGSAVHAVLQPLGLPHIVCFLAQAGVASIVGAPVMPVAGAALFQIGAPRPLKFWQRKFQSSVAQADSLADGSDDGSTETERGRIELRGVEKLDAVLYEHVTLALRRWLAGHIAAGRLGVVQAGGVYLLLSDSLTCMVHIVEVGSGHVTFQVRGLELKGTYCQEREVEAVKEDGRWSGGATLPRWCGGDSSDGIGGGLLPLEGAVELRWNAWKVISTGLPLATYNVNVNPAGPSFATFSSKAVLIRSLVRAAILHLVRHEKLAEWMGSEAAKEAIAGAQRIAVSSDGFHGSMHDDYNAYAGGITLGSFLNSYRRWILFCLNKRRAKMGEPAGTGGLDAHDEGFGVELGEGEGVSRDGGEDGGVKRSHPLHAEEGCEGDVRSGSAGLDTHQVCCMCFLVTLALRRTLLPSRSAAWDGFLQEFHTLLSGRFKSSVPEDEWVFVNAGIVQEVLWPSVRAGLKLQIEYVLQAEEDGDDIAEIHERILGCTDSLVIEAESSPRWRQELLSGAPQLLSLRQQREDETVNSVLEHSLLQLELRYLHFRVVQINPETVRGLWAGQLHELVFLGNQNRERGSIQQMKPILRNIINQSLDPPAGYPIYVSPLVTSLLT